MIAERPTILMPMYTDKFRTRWSWVRHLLLYAALILIGCFYGLVAALLPPDLMLMPLAPIAVLALVILWMLPNVGHFPAEQLDMAFRIFIVGNVVWPIYLAFEVPGLPWITPARAALTFLVLVTLYAVATSHELRDAMLAPLRRHPVFKWALFIWLIMQVITLPFAKSFSDSATRWSNYQVYEGFILFVSLWFFQRPGNARKMGTLVLWAAIFVACIGIWEAIDARVPWAGHVPSFFSVDPAYMAIVLGAQMRAADGLYRAHSVFTVSLVFSEYLAMAMPLLIDRIVNSSSWKKPLLIAAWWALAIGIYESNSRLGVVGFFASHLLYFLIWGVRRWRSEAHDLLGPAAVLGYPAFLLAFSAVVLSSRTLTIRIFGGGQHAVSDDARKLQWSRAWPLIGKNPIGHGAATAPGLVAYSNGAGQMSLDSYPINLLVDYGVIGFSAFVTMLFYPITMGLRLYSRTRDRDLEMAGIAAVVLILFAVGKLALSIGSNNYMAYMYIGMIMALVKRADDMEPTAKD